MRDRHTKRDQRRSTAHGELHQRQHCGTVEVKIETEGFINRQFHRGRARPATKGQSDRKRGQADQEYDQKRAGQNLAQHRAFKRADNVARRHAKRGGKAKPFGRDCQPALQDQPGGQRQVEKHMGQKHAVVAVN